MKKDEKRSIFRKMLKSNLGLLRKISQDIGVSEVALRNISITGNGSDEIKNNVINFLVENNYIREGEYTITEFFDI